MVTFDPNEDVEAVQQWAASEQTTLTAFFNANADLGAVTPTRSFLSTSHGSQRRRSGLCVRGDTHLVACIMSVQQVENVSISGHS